MSESATCPRCGKMLTAANQPDSARPCSAGCGAFLPTTPPLEERLRSTLEPAEADGSNDTKNTDALCCPGCGGSMPRLMLGDVELDRCESCGGVWLDGGEELKTGSAGDMASALGRYLLYSVSLPERTVRSTIGLAAGAAREAASFLVPRSFQSSKTYEIVVRNSLRFLTDDIGGAKSTSEEDDGVDDYMARKAVGNFVELAGLATLHVSPLWLLAVVSDVAYGTKTYVEELAAELKEQGLIDETSTIHNAEDVLQALQNTTGKAASMFDTPPLSVDQLRETLEQTRDAARSADYTGVLPEAELKRYWSEMRAIADREDVSMLGVSGAMTLHSLGKLKTVSQGALTGVRVAGGLFNRNVVGHYVDSLRTINEQGYYRTIRDSYSPYVEAVWLNFSTERETWTEELVTGRTFGKALRALSGWWSGESGQAGSGSTEECEDVADHDKPQ